MSHDQAVEIALSTVRSTSQNGRHGEALLLFQLIENVIDWSQLSSAEDDVIRAKLITWTNESRGHDHPLLKATLQRCVEAFQRWSDTCSIHSDHLIEPRVSGVSLLSDESTDEISVLTILGELDVRILADHGIIRRLMGLAIGTAYSHDVQIAAIGLLCRVDHSLISKVPGLSRAAAENWKAVNLLATSRCVPLAEAALAYLGWIVSVSSSAALESRESSIFRKLLLVFSPEDRSLPSRTASLRCLQAMKNPVFSLVRNDTETPQVASEWQSTTYQVLLRLLQDDDDYLRIGAADIIRKVNKLPRPISQKKAIEVFWTSVVGVPPRRNVAEGSWLWGLSLDDDGFRASCLSRHDHVDSQQTRIWSSCLQTRQRFCSRWSLLTFSGTRSSTSPSLLARCGSFTKATR